MAPVPLFLDTLRALAKPRRAIPILLVSGPLVYAQVAFSRTINAVWLALFMTLAFVLVAPFAWRALFPLGVRVRLPALRLLIFGCVGALLTLVVGFGLADLAGIDQSFITSGEANIITTALFCVGGWGLGRDIELEQRTELLLVEKERAELMAVKSHLDPHFLFNTLNAIAEWCREDGEVAERAVLQLSAMLRTVLRGVREQTWLLSEELALLDTLFALHVLRDPELFTLVRDLPDPLPEVQVPPMILLPLAENAMKHGPAAGHRGEVNLTVRIEDGALVVTLENPGAFGGLREGGEGVRMVERRLALYHPRASVVLSDVNERTRAVLYVPQERA